MAFFKDYLKSYEYENQEFYVCSYENDKLSITKARRILKPCRITLVRNSSLSSPYRKGMYYYDKNNEYMVAVDDNGEVILMSPNVLIFKDAYQCIEAYNECVDNALLRLEEAKLKIQKHFFK